jgi:hypothetical protein
MFHAADATQAANTRIVRTTIKVLIAFLLSRTLEQQSRAAVRRKPERSLAEQGSGAGCAAGLKGAKRTQMA